MGIRCRSISDRQYKLETEYKFKKGDQAKSVFFQKSYGIGMALFIFSIIIFVSGELALAVLIPLAIPSIYIYRAIVGRNESWGDRGRRESHKTAILVRTKGGSYEYRFRKDSYIVLFNSSSICKVCKQKFKTESSLECYFQICTKNDKCIESLAKISGKNFTDYRP
ncbi:MAG: hypothetical protein P8R32_02145 [Candidatus Poseidoniia archaeon]|nr:hypothetical protein [Candidatus Poseidoniia archaeon]